MLLVCDKLLTMKQGGKTVTVGSRMEVELREAARRKARIKGTTISKVMRAFIVGWVNNTLPDPPFDMDPNLDDIEQE